MLVACFDSTSGVERCEICFENETRITYPKHQGGEGGTWSKANGVATQLTFHVLPQTSYDFVLLCWCLRCNWARNCLAMACCGCDVLFLQRCREMHSILGRAHWHPRGQCSGGIAGTCFGSVGLRFVFRNTNLESTQRFGNGQWLGMTIRHTSSQVEVTELGLISTWQLT